MLPEAEIEENAQGTRVRYADYVARVLVKPIHIDPDAVHESANMPAIKSAARHIRNKPLNKGRKIGVDMGRADRMKGDNFRLAAFDRLFTAHPDLRREFTFIQPFAPSRNDIAENQAYFDQIKRETDALNAKWGDPNWVPVQNYYRMLKPSEALAHFHAADTALIFSWRDGYNLVAAEAVAAGKNNLVLVLSKNTGIARVFGDAAILIDPTDPQQAAEAVYKANTMNPQDRLVHNLGLRQIVFSRSVHKWVAENVAAIRELTAGM